MRIAIVTTQCPFVRGGAEMHADSLLFQLRARGYEAEIISLPFKWYPAPVILDHMLAAQATDISEYNGVPIDLAICLKFPAYYVRHPNKVFWILHQHRQAYDLWDSNLSDLFDDNEGLLVREAIIRADNEELKGAKKIFSNSKTVAQRLKKYNNINSVALYHPPPLAGQIYHGSFGDFFYYPSRITPSKRQEFVLEALALTEKNVRVVFSGSADDPSYDAYLKNKAIDLGISDRIQWLGFISDKDILEFYATCCGVLFTPIDEDLGYVALEAMLAGKPIITLENSGEPASLVRNEVEGVVAKNNAKSLAEGMDKLWKNENLCTQYGRAARVRYDEINPTWDAAIDTLLGTTHHPIHLKKTTYNEPEQDRSEVNEIDSVGESAEDLNNSSIVRKYQNIDFYKKYISSNEFQEFNDDLREYLKVHEVRYKETLDIIKKISKNSMRILDVGTSSPYIFGKILYQEFNIKKYLVIEEALDHFGPVVTSVLSNGIGEFDKICLNVETDIIPIEKQTMDLVLCMEILEHFAIDPLYVLKEMYRILKDDGYILITTPNIASRYALDRISRGESPYSFGLYTPWNGVYGRHNREFTPAEVSRLAYSAGFTQISLKTIDVYPHDVVSGEVQQLLAKRDDKELQNQNIFFLGKKRKVAENRSVPEELFVFDPSIFSGSLQLRQVDENRFIFTIKNNSSVKWVLSDVNCVNVKCQKININNYELEEERFISLESDLDPYNKIDINMTVERVAGKELFLFKFSLNLSKWGSFLMAGRSNSVSILCNNFELWS